MKKLPLKNNRMISQDIAKGIAIFLVILVHSIQVTTTIGSVIGVLFGYIMPFFLFMAGYNYNDKNLSVKDNLKRRTLQLLKPFLIFSLGVFVVMGSYFLIRGEATILELFKSYFIFLISKWGLGFLGWEFNQILFQRLLGPCWFIQFLIVADLIFIPFYSFVKNNNKRLFSSIILLSGISVVLISFNIVLPWGIQNAPAIAGLMLLASSFKKNDLLFKKDYKIKYIILNAIVCLLTIGLIQLKYNGAGYFGAGELGKVLGEIEVYIFYIMAVCGSYFIINFSKLLEKTNHIKRFLIWFGQNSMLILIVHMSIVHIIKDIFKLEQRNAVDRLFGDKIILMEIPATIVILIVVSLFVLGFNKLNNKRKQLV